MISDQELKQQPAILFVDDEANVLRSLQRLFLGDNMDVMTATSGNEGLRILREHEIAVVVSDQRMPGMNGAEFLEHVRHLSQDTVRIILTGQADVCAAMDAINKGGAYRYLTKPWDDNEFVSTVKDAAERFRLIKVNAHLSDLTRKQNEELKRWSQLLATRVKQQTAELEQQNLELKALNAKIQKNFRESIVAFSSLIELRDKDVHSHSHHVALLSGAICKKIGLAGTEEEKIQIAAQLHDIGKIAIPDLMLSKPLAELSPDEAQEYRRHPVLGQSTIDSIEDLQEVGILVRHHHETMDGNGFPDGLKGDGIPLGSRIIAIADAFDEYLNASRFPANHEEILNRIKANLRVKYDYDLYAPLAQSVRENLEILMRISQSDEVELVPSELKEGMVVSRDVRSGTGLLLMSAGYVLNERSIEVIRRCYHFDPINSGVFVKTRF